MKLHVRDSVSDSLDRVPDLLGCGVESLGEVFYRAGGTDIDAFGL